MTACWHCWAGGVMAAQAVCAACGAVQPPQAIDHFALLAQPRSFDQDLSALEQAYLSRQQLVHPDRLVGRSARERAYAAAHSANLNDAWKTLRDPLNRALYLCQLLGIDLASSDGRFADAPQLLQENMELHEALMEAAGDVAATATLHHQIDQLVQQQLRQLSDDFAAGDAPAIRLGTLRLQFLSKLHHHS